MSWIAALQAFATRGASTVASHTVGAKCTLYDRLARVHLRDVTHNSDGLAVLRQARWELMRSGTQHSRGQLLEHILASFAEAANVLCRSTRQSTATDSKTSPLLVTESILLEQLQCLVEAKVSGIRIDARHLRHLLHTPQLSAISPTLPQLILQEILAQPSHIVSSTEEEEGESTASTESKHIDDDDARVDCAVALACAGHASLAIRLCTAASFVRVIRAVGASEQQESAGSTNHDSWELAWALVEAAPRGVFMDDTASGAEWRAGLLEAVRGRFRASGYKSPAMKDWLTEFMQQYQFTPHTTAQQSENNITHSTSSSTASNKLRRVPREVMEAYVAVCPVGAWREALEAVLRYNAEVDSTTKSNSSSEQASRVPMGLVLTLLQLARQPGVILRLFYGTASTANCASEAKPRLPKGTSTDASSVTTAQLFALPSTSQQQEQQQNDAKEDTDTVFNAQDRQHPALYNHIMTALAAVGQWQLAMQMYQTMTISTAKEAATPTAEATIVQANAYTHLCAARILLRGTGSESIPRATDNVYTLAVRAMERLAQLPRHSPVAHKLAPEMDGLREGLALWAATRGGEWGRVRRLARAASSSSRCRYIQLIALVATLKEYDTVVAASRTEGKEVRDEAELVATVRELCEMICRSPRRSLQQVCLTLAFVANSASAMRACSSSESTAETSKDAVCLVPSVHRALCEALGAFAGNAQPAFDHAVKLLIHDFCLVQRAQRTSSTTPSSPLTTLSLQPPQLLASTVQLMSGVVPYAECWRVLLQILKDVAAEQRLSVAHAAPLLLARGVPADVAINFLPQ